MGRLKQTSRLDVSGQAMVKYPLLAALAALVVVTMLARPGTSVGDVMTMIGEVPGSRCRPGLQMV